MASAVNSLLGSSTSSGTAASSGGTPAPSEEVFLQLLVSQIKNQDPLNPTDSTQFVSQLAQFSELEQVIAIRSDIETAMSASAPPSTTNPAAPTGTSTNSANPADTTNPAVTSTTTASTGTSTTSLN
jgi:flagellar basal-body rod modification protein FlgD